jgi:hypothetical protein
MTPVLCRILSPHRRTAFASSPRANMRFAFPLLLVGRAARLLTLRPGQVSFVFALAFVLRSTGLIQGDRDGLAAILDFAGLSPVRKLAFDLRSARSPSDITIQLFVHALMNEPGVQKIEWRVSNSAGAMALKAGAA